MSEASKMPARIWAPSDKPPYSTAYIRADIAEQTAEALRGMDCPRPCNGRPEDFSIGQCFDAGECGCTARAALSAWEASNPAILKAHQASTEGAR